MSRQRAPPPAVPVVVRRSMNDHGTMTVEVERTKETRYLVDYASDRIRSVLSALPAGTEIPVQMTRVGGRANVWKACGIPSVSSRSRLDAVG